MPQLIAIALVGGLVYYAWRVLRREMARIGEEVADQDRARTAKEIAPLEKGPDGVYRPKDPQG